MRKAEASVGGLCLLQQAEFAVAVAADLREFQLDGIPRNPHGAGHWWKVCVLLTARCEGPGAQLQELRGSYTRLRVAARRGD